MALTTITDADISGVLKNVYENFRINAFPRLTPLLAQLKKGKPGGPERMQWGGNGVFWDVVLTRPVGMTGSPSGYFPPNAQATEKQATVGIKRTYVTRQFDMLAVSGTQSKEAAFIPLIRKLTQEAMDAAKLGQQEVLHGDGRAIKALVTAVNSTTEIVVQSPYGLAGAGRGGLLLDVGMYVAVLDTGSADAVLGRATITAVSNSGDSATLTLDTAISSMAATDKIVPATASDTSFNAVPNGLINLLNRGASFDSLHGLSAATYSRWDTTRMVAGTDTPDAGQPSEMDVWDLCTRVANRSGKDPKSVAGQFLLISTPGIEKKLAESFLGQRRFDMASNITLKGGFKALNIAGLPLISDFWCPAGTIYLVHIPSLSFVDRQDWVKLAYEGSGPFRFISGRDAYEVNFGSYWNTAAIQRNSHGMITGYTDTVRYDHTI
ncbi:MAG TPA: hypothetical protein VMX15_00030 [Candidatus Heimdallarchaeota archaeon]|nr:hypothetical protein [Candidatus Heimdallarchaeota archaeon]